MNEDGLCKIQVDAESETDASITFDADDSIQPVQSIFLMTDRKQAFLTGSENENTLGKKCSGYVSDTMLKAFTNRTLACLNTDYFGSNIVPLRTSFPLKLKYAPSFHFVRSEMLSCHPPDQCKNGNVSAYRNIKCDVKYNKLICNQLGTVVKVFNNRFEPNVMEIVQGTTILFKNTDTQKNGIYDNFQETSLECIGAVKNLSVGVHTFYHSRYPNRVSFKLHVCESDSVCTNSIAALKNQNVMETHIVTFVVVTCVLVVGTFIFCGVLHILYGRRFIVNKLMSIELPKVNLPTFKLPSFKIPSLSELFGWRTTRTVPVEGKNPRDLKFSDLMNVETGTYPAAASSSSQQKKTILRYNVKTGQFVDTQGRSRTPRGKRPRY